MNENNGWNEWQKFMAGELSSIREDIAELKEEFNQFKGASRVIAWLGAGCSGIVASILTHWIDKKI